MRSKNLVVALLVVLALAVSGFTYAFWSAGVAADSETATGTVKVGTGETVTSTVNVSAAVSSMGALDRLVPSGFEGTNKISSLTLTFTVDWDSTNADASLLTSTLTASLTGASNGTPAENAAVLALFNASFNNSGSYTVITDGAAVSVIATITIDEPADQAEYLLIATKDITLTFSFSVAASNTAA